MTGCKPTWVYVCIPTCHPVRRDLGVLRPCPLPKVPFFSRQWGKVGNGASIERIVWEIWFPIFA